MNRRNFVVGLGTVATISGVASVTSAAFSGDSVSPSTNFQIVPEDSQLVVQRLQDTVSSYSNLASGNASWNDSEITDFGNVTAEQGSPVVAHLNTSENGQLGAQLAFNNTNATGTTEEYSQYTVDNADGFFEVANLGDTQETIAVDLVPFSDNVGSDPGDALTEDQVYQMFEFQNSSGAPISPPDSNTNTHPNTITISAGGVEAIGLEINITNDMYNSIQSAAGGAFSQTEPSIRLLDSITVGIDPNT